MRVTSMRSIWDRALIRHVLSRVLCAIEAEVSRVIRGSVAAERLPEDRDLDVLVNFVAVMAGGRHEFGG